CQELVDLMDGQLWVESEVGRGSMFHFTARFPLPTDVEVIDEQARTQMDVLRGLPVLVVDDSAANRCLLADALSAWSMHPVVVGDAVSALSRLQEAAARNRRFPLVIVDALMPGMDGFTLAERIQE